MRQPRAVQAVWIAFLVLVVLGYGQSTNSKTPAAKGWQLTWSDEFNAADGSLPDPSHWTLETGGDGWGNEEWEYYTARPKNAHIQDGSLLITAFREIYMGPDGVTRHYTSARLKTQNHFVQAYGRFEARIRIPFGQGMWPAFWMMGENIEQAGWPTGGEIDIMENMGKEPARILGTIHGPGYSGAQGISGDLTLPSGRFADDYHVFAVEWEPNVIRFYVDQDLYATRTPADLPPGTKWVYDHPFFILLNLAVGGNFGGNPDQTTTFPQTMAVDYVRVYKRASSKTQ